MQGKFHVFRVRLCSWLRVYQWHLHHHLNASICFRTQIKIGDRKCGLCEETVLNITAWIVFVISFIIITANSVYLNNTKIVRDLSACYFSYSALRVTPAHDILHQELLRACISTWNTIQSESEIAPYSIITSWIGEPFALCSAVHMMACSHGTPELTLSTCRQHVHVIQVVNRHCC